MVIDQPRELAVMNKASDAFWAYLRLTYSIYVFLRCLPTNLPYPPLLLDILNDSDGLSNFSYGISKCSYGFVAVFVHFWGNVRTVLHDLQLRYICSNPISLPILLPINTINRGSLSGQSISTSLIACPCFPSYDSISGSRAR